jgi:CheY-like chemotaxis protein
VLDCDGRPDEGADFWFEIPLTRVGGVQSPSAPFGPGDAGETDARAFPARILLADDHPANRKVVEIMLADMPTELVAVEDGRQAVEAFRKGGFDMVLMDMQMPVMDGLTATAAIRALEAGENRVRTPIIMLTANALPDHVEAGRVAGADGHLSKPITLVGLLDGVAAALAAAERRENPVAA